jgi:transcription initiation factor TFIIH subunit 1
MKTLDPLSDLSADVDACLPEGYGIVLDDAQRPKKLVKVLPLIRKFNRHGALVLGSPTFNDPKILQNMPLNPTVYNAKVDKQVTLTELEASTNPEVVALRIQDPRRYFDGHASSMPKYTEPHASVSVQDFSRSFQTEIASWEPNLCHAIVVDGVAQLIMHDLQILSNVQSQSSSDPLQELGLPDYFMKEFYEAFDTGNELLRHFWGSVPKSLLHITKSCKQMEKLKKLNTNISRLYDHLEHLKHSLPADEKRRTGNWRRLFSHTTESLNKALVKMHQIDEEITRKT